MLFNSIQYIIFLPIVVLLYFSLHHKFRWIILLIASYYFYMCWRPEYILLIISSTIVGYVTALKIEKHIEKKKRKFYLLFSICFNVALLFIFKYFNFFLQTLSPIFNGLKAQNNVPHLNLVLPVGISFYTFQILSYSIDVYRNENKAERHFGIFSLYVSFFPQLVAGPIERSKRLLPQFSEVQSFNYQNAVLGLRLILWGMFKKVVIADRLAIFVDTVYGNTPDYKGLLFIIATIFFVFQVYCDFSAYSDIAIGSARIMGFKLMKNFDCPLFARSLSEFWQKWHISLTSWIRDYVYTPLTINTRYWGIFGLMFSILITFLLVGIWHGANWTFIVFGILYGVAIIIEIKTKKLRKLLFKNTPLLLVNSFGILFTFAFFCFTCIFFRSANIQEALYIISTLGTINMTIVIQYIINDFGVYDFILLLFFLCAFVNIELVIKYNKHLFKLFHSSSVFRWSAYYILIFCIVFFGVFGQKEFVYFQF